MKRFQLSIVLCLIFNSYTFACGFYPYGEDIRFNLLKPTKVFPGLENGFFYTSNQFYGEYDFIGDSKNHFNENLSLWESYLNNKVDKASIYEAVYQSSILDLKNKSSQNAMIQLLQLKENRAIQNYLTFAIQCSDYNSPFDDPWERSSNDSQKKRTRIIKKALKYASKQNDLQLKKRYAHLAIRLAHYNGDHSMVNKIYQDFFAVNENQDALDLWALHFKIQSTEISPERNILVARVFAYSIEKRYAIYSFYNRSLDFDYVFSLAKTDKDRAALAYLQSSTNLEKSIKYVELFAQNSKDEALLTELALREVNKLEDWVLTPYYSNFAPSTPINWDFEGDQKQLNDRMSADREYALEFSNWMKTTKNQFPWWNSLQLYSQFIAQDFDGLSKKITVEEKLNGENANQKAFLSQLLALTKVASHEDKSLNDLSVQQSLLDAFENEENVFLFAMAKELEYADNKTDAACLLAHVNKKGDWDEAAYWKTKELHHSLNSDVYYEYFTYLDVSYTIDEMNALIAYLNTNVRKSKFRGWMDSEISKEQTRLYDLVGTKYFRKDQLEKALESFKKVDDSLWTSEFYYYKDYLNEDPFINNFYSRGIQPEYDSKTSYTKPEIVEKMIGLKATYNSETGNKKAMAAYLLANAYRNTSQYGNAWMMRRYYWSSTAYETGIEDDDEYFECNLAKKYYLLASKASKASKFRIVSLRMAGKCESYKIYHEADSYYLSDEEYDALFKSNRLYKVLKMKYPEDYDLVISNCDVLQGYFDAGLN